MFYKYFSQIVFVDRYIQKIYNWSSASLPSSQKNTLRQQAAFACV